MIIIIPICNIHGYLTSRNNIKSIAPCAASSKYLERISHERSNSDQFVECSHEYINNTYLESDITNFETLDHPSH